MEAAHRSDQQVPPARGKNRGVGEMGMWVILASLGMLFAGGAASFVAIRYWLNSNRADAGDVPLPAVELPGLLWLSTAAIVLSSATFHLALRSISAGQVVAFRRHLAVSTGLALVFLGAQAPCLVRLLAEHWDGLATKGEKGGEMSGLVFVLISVHALHLIGGLWPLGRVLIGARRDRYTAKAHDGVRFLAMYWHFLDIVWLVLFATLLLTP